ncbi:ferrous iron transport protein A [Comamonas serinivorans]|uniref:Ferrous iron transport protein A n=1 Tax=Comamonas serinivorans TaxID=1082851 RepID=A0A1Y0EL62_9BURK|nr:FeoA domain-containing protein [Comamonas serinivorans]ARU04373.1 ferrous iron transport protein A [Comamonas serinivorans]
MTLDQWPSHVPARVRELARPSSQDLRDLVLRLTEIGFVPGEVVHIMATGLLGREPLAVRLGHTTFALRQREAQLVDVEALDAGVAGPGREWP